MWNDSEHRTLHGKFRMRPLCPSALVKEVGVASVAVEVKEGAYIFFFLKEVGVTSEAVDDCKVGGYDLCLSITLKEVWPLFLSVSVKEAWPRFPSVSVKEAWPLCQK